VLGETGTRFHLILGHGYQELDFVQIGDAETMLRIVRELQQPISYFTTDRPLGANAREQCSSAVSSRRPEHRIGHLACGANGSDRFLHMLIFKLALKWTRSVCLRAC